MKALIAGGVCLLSAFIIASLVQFNAVMDERAAIRMTTVEVMPADPGETQPWIRVQMFLAAIPEPEKTALAREVIQRWVLRVGDFIYPLSTARREFTQGMVILWFPLYTGAPRTVQFERSGFWGAHLGPVEQRVMPRKAPASWGRR